MSSAMHPAQRELSRLHRLDDLLIAKRSVVAMRGVAALLTAAILFPWTGNDPGPFRLVLFAYLLVDGSLALTTAVGLTTRDKRSSLLAIEASLEILIASLMFTWTG